MPINVEHNVDPRLLGQAAYLSGQGMATQDALRALNRYGGGAPRQQTFNLGKLPQTGVAQVSDAIANGQMGGDQGLAQDDAIRQGDTGGSLYDPSTSPAPAADPRKSIYNPDGSYSEEFYGGDATRNMDYTPEQRVKLDKLNQTESKIREREDWTPEEKAQGLQQIMDQRASIQPIMKTPQKPYDVKGNVTRLDDGTQIFMDAQGKAHVIPYKAQQQDPSMLPTSGSADMQQRGMQPDPTPLDPNDPSTMQPTPVDPTQQLTPQEKHYRDSTFTDPDTGVKMYLDKSGNPHPVPMPKPPPKPPATEKDETRSQFMKEYNAVRKELTKTDAEGNVTTPTKDEILQHMKDATSAFEEFHGRKAHSNIPQPSAGGPDDGPDAQAATQQPPQQVKTAQDYAAVPRGAQYMDVYGHIRMKQ